LVALLFGLEILRSLGLAQNDRAKYMSKQYYVYIMASRSHVLYAGVTNDLQRRVEQHKQKAVEGFTQKYNVTRLVYYEMTNDVHVALNREKEIKGWLRKKKIALIESMNPQWRDLSEEWE
jgi:putative endonuclease